MAKSHSHQVAEAFFAHFFDSEKRTQANPIAFSVYAGDSIARITRAKEDGTTEEVTLNGVESVTMYNLALPPSALTLVHYDAVPTHNDGIVIMATGTEIIQITDYPWYRSIVLAPTPQGAFYVKADMLYYGLGTVLAPQVITLPPEQVVQTVEPVVEPAVEPVQVVSSPVEEVQTDATTPAVLPTKKRQIRENKPRQPRTLVGKTEESPVSTEVVPEVVVEVIPEPVVVVEEIIPVPTPVPKPVVVVEVTPHNSKKSWSELVGGKDIEKRSPKVVKKEEEVVKEVAPAPKVAVKKVEEVKPIQKVTSRPTKCQVLAKPLPSNATKDSLFIAFTQYADVTDVQLHEGNQSATVTFSTPEEASIVLKLKTVAIGSTTVNIAPKAASQSANGFRSQRK